MSIKSYKLVPVKYFNLLKGNQKNKTCENESLNSPPKRTIGEIQESNINFHEDMRSPEFMSTTPPKGENVSRGGMKYEKQNVPIWTSGDSSTLPEFSQAANLRSSFKGMQNVLENKNISDHLKVKLYQIFRDKYDKIRTLDDDDSNDIEDDGAILASDAKMVILMKIIDEVKSRYNKSLARALGNVMISQPKNIAWDKFGNITKPKIGMEESLNLQELIEILISKRRGTVRQLNVVRNVIKPFYGKINSYIRNGKILKQMFSKGKNSYATGTLPGKYII